MDGGISAEVSAVDAGGHELVLKRYVDRAWLAREPDLAEREARVLRLLEAATVPAPELVAVDGDGSVTGAPSLLMTRLDGRHQWQPPSIEAFARVGVAIHAVPPPAGFRRYRRYHRDRFETPASSVWQEAVAVMDGIDVDVIEPRGFIQRDHHAGNVLWSGGRVSGVIDWVEACEGPLAIDAARARVNLVWEVGLEAAREYSRCEGVIVDPVCDVLDALDCLGYGRPDEPRLDELTPFVAEALALIR